MPAKNPRINVVLDASAFEKVRSLAEKDKVSLSTKAKELIKEALEVHEDLFLKGFAEDREASWKDQTALSHEDLWS